MSINKRLGESIRGRVGVAWKMARKKLELTQVGIAEITGTSQSKISKIEKLQLEPSLVEWFLFCQTTSIDPSVILLSDSEMAAHIEKTAKIKVIPLSTRKAA